MSGHTYQAGQFRDTVNGVETWQASYLVLNLKHGFFWILLICLLATGLAVFLIGGIDPDLIEGWLQQAGIWAPIVYVVVYAIATLLILPSTALNLVGGAIFGPWLGTLWTSIAAIVAAIVAFGFARGIGRRAIAHKLAGRWQAIDAELGQGGLFYMFAIRLLPIIPYGLVNFAAGLSSVRFKDYVLGTLLGTVPGIFPFVLIGDSGKKALKTGDVLPLMGALALASIMVGVATWYRRHRRYPREKLQRMQQPMSSSADPKTKDPEPPS